MDIVKENNSQVTPEGTRDKKLFNYDFYGEKKLFVWLLCFQKAYWSKHLLIDLIILKM